MSYASEQLKYHNNKTKTNLVSDEKFIEDMITGIRLRFRETEEEFIVENILPFCSEITEKVILKEDLIKALHLYFDKGSAYNNGYLEGYKDGSKAVRKMIIESIEKRWGKNE